MELKLNNIHIDLKYIPAHRGISRNEIVDNIAKVSLLLNNIEENDLDWQEMNPVYKKEMIKNSTIFLELEAKIKGKKFFQLSKPFSLQPWFSEFKIPRDTLGLINRIKTGHYLLNYHLHRKNIILDKKCPCGYISMDIDHVIWDCQLYNNDRNLLFKKLRNLGIYPGSDIQSIFITNNIDPILEITHFIQLNKIPA